MAGKPRAARRFVASEHDEQVAFVAWFRLQFPKILIFAIPNGAYLSGTPGQRAAQMARLKAEGLMPGVPDLHVPEWNLWIEFKRQSGGRVSPVQSDIIATLRDMGRPVIIARGCDDAVAQVKALAEVVR